MGNSQSPGQAVTDPDDSDPEEVIQHEIVPSPLPPSTPPAERETHGQEVRRSGENATLELIEDTIIRLCLPEVLGNQQRTIELMS